MTGPAEMRELAERLRKQLQQNRMTVYMDGSGYFNRYDVEAAEAALREAAERVGAMELQHDIDMSRMNADWNRMLERAEAAEQRAERLEKTIRDYLAGDYDHPGTHRPMPCQHGVEYYHDCRQCDEAHFLAALAQEGQT